MARITLRTLILVAAAFVFVAYLALSSGGCRPGNQRFPERYPQVKGIGASISGDQSPIHAVVDAVSFGEPPAYQHKTTKWSDVRIGDSFPFVEGERTRRIYLLIQGILHSPSTSGLYGDVLKRWRPGPKKFKCCSLVKEQGLSWSWFTKIRRGPRARETDHSPQIKLTITFSGERNSEACVTRPLPSIRHEYAQPFSRSKKQKTSEAADHAAKPVSPFELELVDYCFRQNRALFALEAPAGSVIHRLEFDTKDLDSEFRGFLHVRAFRANVGASPQVRAVQAKTAGRWYPETCSRGDDNCIVFEEYAPAPDFLKIIVNGYRTGPMLMRDLSVSVFPLEATREAVYPFSLLLPVGYAGIRLTARTIDNLTAGQEVLASVEGLFTFSGFSPGIRDEQGEVQGDDPGGGGGVQDAQFRMDHLRGLRPPIYPNQSLLFDSALRMYDPGAGWVRRIKYSVLDGKGCERDRDDLVCEGEWKASLGDPGSIDRNHRYWIKFVVPESGKVSFFVRDDTDLAKTWDNCGALVVSVFPPVEKKDGL